MQAVSSEMILSDGVLGFDTSTFIPVSFNTKPFYVFWSTRDTILNFYE